MKVGELFFVLGLRSDPSWREAEERVGHLRKALLGLAVLAAGNFLAGLVHGATETARELGVMSHALGMSLRQTQEWQAVAQKSNVNIKQFSTGIGALEMKLRTFANGGGGKNLAKSMKEAGISVADAKRAIASPDGLNALLFKLSDRLHALGTTPQSTSMIKAITSARGGQALVDVLDKGSGAIKAQMAQRRKMGELDTNQVRDLRKLGDEYDNVKMSVMALVNQAVARAAPMLVAMFKSIEDWVGNAANRERVFAALNTVFQVLSDVVGVAMDVLSALGDVISWIAEDPLSVIVAAVVLFGTVLADTAAAAILEWIEILGPIALVAGAIFAITEVVRYLGDKFSWLGDFLSSTGGKFTLFGALGLAAVVGLLGPIGAVIAGLQLIDDLLGSGGIQDSIKFLKKQQTDKKEQLKKGVAALDYNNGATQGSNGTTHQVNATPAVAHKHTTIHVHPGPTHIVVHAPGANGDVVKLIDEKWKALKQEELRHAQRAVGERGDQ